MMKGIYLMKNNNMKFFIGSLDEKALVEIDEIDDITAISEFAFANSDAENILLKGQFSSIRESAFENCDKLKTVIFGELGGDEVFKDHYGQKTSILKNVVVAPVTGDFTIHANAFKGCSSLTSLVLPQIDGTLTIEKDTFFGCEKLRAVVATCDYATFSGNPFSCCPAHLTFVCKKDSDVDRFARENDYRRIHVDQYV